MKTIVEQILNYVRDRVAGTSLKEAWFIDLNDPHGLSLPRFLLDEFVISVREIWPTVFEEGEYDSTYMTEEACHLIIEWMISKNISGLNKIWGGGHGGDKTFIEFYNSVKTELINRMNFRQNGETSYCPITGALLGLRPSDDNEILESLTTLNNPAILTLEEYQWIDTIPDQFWETDEDGQKLLIQLFQPKIDDGSIFLPAPKPAPPRPII
jgi:hypothetical protein